MTARFTSLSYPQGKSTPQKYLGRYFKKYSFFVGEIVLDEITRKHGELLKLIRFEELVNITKRYDYSALLIPSLCELLLIWLQPLRHFLPGYRARPFRLLPFLDFQVPSSQASLPPPTKKKEGYYSSAFAAFIDFIAST